MSNIGNIQIPSLYTGRIVTLTGIDFCMDGIKHGLVVAGDASIIRIIGRNPQAQAEIEKWADVQPLVPISVIGYVERSAECTHLSVFFVGTMQDFVTLSGDRVGNG